MKYLYIFILFSFSSIFCTSTTSDFEQYSTIGLLKEFNKNFNMSFDVEYQRYNGLSANYLHTQFGVIYKNASKHLELSAFYRFLTVKRKDKRINGQRFKLNLMFKGKADKFRFINRIGWEYRDRRAIYNIFFIKDMIKIGYELKSKNSIVQPYIADEILIDVNENSSHRNRLYIGVSSNQNNFLLLDFYSYWERSWKSFSHSLKNSYIFGLTITFFIPEKENKVVKSIHYHRSH